MSEFPHSRTIPSSFLTATFAFGTEILKVLATPVAEHIRLYIGLRAAGLFQWHAASHIMVSDLYPLA